MKPIVFITLIAASVLASRSCFKNRGTVDQHNGYEDVILQPPAADAAEWIRRLTPRKQLVHAFAELPPQAEWNAVVKHLRQSGDYARAHKLRLLGNLLAGDNAAVSKDLRSLVLTNPESLENAYTGPHALEYLHIFSEDPAETRRWIEKSLPKPKPDNYTYSSNTDEIYQLLASNEVDGALGKLREKSDAERRLSTKLQTLGRLAEVARLTDRTPLYEKAVAEMKDIAERIPLDHLQGIYTLSGVFGELVHLKDWREIRGIAIRCRSQHRTAEFQRICLAATYEIDGPSAFLAELRLSHQYGIDDSYQYLEFITNDDFAIGERIIRALMGAGEKDNARATLTYLLALGMENDAYYRLALEFFPEQAEGMFESLRAFDSYEERPLIWLAELALGKNDLERARTLIDRAITLDPSDGEQGKDTRMQAYDVLSRILRAQGDVAKADFFSHVTQAIRRGERADEYRNAGLRQEATRRYQEALGEFGDAYCLQSRLAKSLLEAGKEEEAMRHFEKAFELMPLSFGPVENLCVGCERIFSDKRVQQVALKTFNRLIETTPENPRTFYFLGLLCEEMKMPDQALAAFKKGLELDPEYYNCATRLLKLQLADPDAVRDARETQRRIEAMAPYKDLREIYRTRTDLRQAWLDARTVSPSPLKLEPLPLPFKIETKNSGGHPFYVGDMQALDGWSPQELLDNNTLVEWIDTF